jgi:hypothetical protein
MMFYFSLFGEQFSRGGMPKTVIPLKIFKIFLGAGLRGEWRFLDLER